MVTKKHQEISDEEFLEAIHNFIKENDSDSFSTIYSKVSGILLNKVQHYHFLEEEEIKNDMLVDSILEVSKEVEEISIRKFISLAKKRMNWKVLNHLDFIHQDLRVINNQVDSQSSEGYINAVSTDSTINPLEVFKKDILPKMKLRKSHEKCVRQFLKSETQVETARVLGISKQSVEQAVKSLRDQLKKKKYSLEDCYI